MSCSWEQQHSDDLVLEWLAHKLLALQQSVRDELLRPDGDSTLGHGVEKICKREQAG
jgi:hypothetical protein